LGNRWVVLRSASVIIEKRANSKRRNQQPHAQNFRQSAQRVRQHEQNEKKWNPTQQQLF